MSGSGIVSSFTSPTGGKGATGEGISFGLRAEQQGHVLMLDVRLRSGVRIALPYSYLSHVNFDPSAAIVADFSTHAVTIQGRNLRPIYEGLLVHRIEWVQEGDPRHDPHPEAATYITRITVPANER